MTGAQIAFLSVAVPMVVLSVPLAVYWTVVCGRILQTLWSLPTGMDGIGLAERSPRPDRSVVVVVPAHNEAGSDGSVHPPSGGAASTRRYPPVLPVAGG